MLDVSAHYRRPCIHLRTIRYQLTLFALEHASSHELLTAVIQTLQQHMEVWACLNMMANITSSLYTAHVTWKSRGVQSRPLLNLLLDVDDGHHLEQAAREQVSADSSAFAHVSIISYLGPVPT